jgi:hypothetical protein
MSVTVGLIRHISLISPVPREIKFGTYAVEPICNNRFTINT